MACYALHSLQLDVMPFNLTFPLGAFTNLMAALYAYHLFETMLITFYLIRHHHDATLYQRNVDGKHSPLPPSAFYRDGAIEFFLNHFFTEIQADTFPTFILSGKFFVKNSFS